MRNDSSLDTNSAHYFLRCPRTDTELLKGISQQEHLDAGRHHSQLCSLLWTGSPHLSVVRLPLIDCLGWTRLLLTVARSITCSFDL